MPASQPSAATEEDGAVESCDVCIVGAGITGLNALFVARRYLERDQKVILVDRRQRVGGMWVDTYPYVSLRATAPTPRTVHRREHQVDARAGSVLPGDKG
ncbi:NAD(P)-binding protein [Rhodococcus sp. MH15]|uniref:NAD(P)-binding protein n=1 Tax=Rhodococcus sp. MH15 TaxID=1761014 RepID=UPI0035A83F9A